MNKTPRTDAHCQQIIDDALGLEYAATELQYWAEKLEEELAAGAEELAACSAAFDKQQEQLDRNADQIVELISETKLVVEKNKVLCELLAECQKDADRYARVRQHLRNGHNTLDMRGTDSDADFDALLDKHLTKGNKVYKYRDIASEVAQEAAAHTDHPLRHYDRTCPACNPKKEWVGLTMDEIWQTIDGCTLAGDLHTFKFAYAIDFKLKKKNIGNQFIPDWPSGGFGGRCTGGVVKKEWEDGYENGYQAGMAEKKPWIGLTDIEAADCWSTSAVTTWENFEAKLKEKNGG